LNRALVDDELDIVNKAIYGEGNEYDVLATATHETTSKVCSVTRHSMQRLKPGEWLNDEVINYFLRIYLTRVDKRLGNPTRVVLTSALPFFCSDCLMRRTMIKGSVGCTITIRWGGEDVKKFCADRAGNIECQ